MADRKLGIRITVDEKGVKVGLKKVERDAKRFEHNLEEGAKKRGEGWGEKLTEGLKEKVKKLGPILAKSMKALAGSTAAAFTAPFVAALGKSLVSGTVTALHGLGAAAALLPAAALAGAVALGTLKLAVSGVGDALSAGWEGDAEAFAEALENLSPAAREFTKTLVGLKPVVESLRTLVQESFFGEFAKEVDGVSRIYLRQLHLVLDDVAASFGSAIGEAAAFLQTPPAFRRIYNSLVNVSTAIGNITAGLPNLLRALLPVVHVGSQFLPGLTKGFEAATDRLADFVEKA